jgi:hypothetical protein
MDSVAKRTLSSSADAESDPYYHAAQAAQAAAERASVLAAARRPPPRPKVHPHSSHASSFVVDLRLHRPTDLRRAALCIIPVTVHARESTMSALSTLTRVMRNRG